MESTQTRPEPLTDPWHAAGIEPDWLRVILALADLLEDGPILLYDGNCGVCSQAVQWVLAHERSHSLRFAALESAVGSELRRSAGVPADVDSMLWTEWRDGRVHADIRSSALLRVLDYIGGPWRWLTALRVVPAFLRDAGYRTLAKWRYRLRAPSCLVPSAHERVRFLGLR
ncbi:MAG TPA: DCC1-like thiol-disulfide oxidoreductase family protein [Polyangiaceae bacterium]|nr:DCC1-like thiol-disulfide oxidoreductase family protein [Polyangiaceae bacterium]